ncbi:LysR family transcriptional regulator [Xanthobacter autotrophicus]|uniref:LysR family transcriptional regulator n=1 Tax=Xanthobacter autotrophicus TaxID=280 RepID=UPI00372A4404
MDLRDIDLNLLVVFNELLKTGRVNAAAVQLGLTQPAVSNALTRLRRILGDELFVRTSQGMQPTPYALSLSEPVSYALGAIHSALNQKVAFDPGRSSQSFTIAMTDIGEIFFLPDLMQRMANAAPNASLSTVRNQTIDLDREMESGNVHLALGHLPDLQAGYFQRRLFSQRYVCLFRRGHRFDGLQLTADDFSAAEQISVVAAGTGHGLIDELFGRMGVSRKIKLRVPHFVSVGHILSSTEMIATVPEVLARRISKPFDLAWCAHPIPLPEISIGMFWHSKFHKDSSNQWLRNLIYDTFSQ